MASIIGFLVAVALFNALHCAFFPKNYVTILFVVNCDKLTDKFWY